MRFNGDKPFDCSSTVPGKQHQLSVLSDVIIVITVTSITAEPGVAGHQVDVVTVFEQWGGSHMWLPGAQVWQLTVALTVSW